MSKFNTLESCILGLQKGKIGRLLPLLCSYTEKNLLPHQRKIFPSLGKNNFSRTKIGFSASK